MSENESSLPGLAAPRAAILGIPEPAPARFLVHRPSWPWMVVGVTCIGAFMGQVDASIVQLALPALERAFAAPLSEVSWVAVAYVLAFAAVLAIFGRLAEIAGRKGLYMAGFALFGLTSALCGLAPDLPSLIALRAAQGASGAMVGANSIAILVAVAGPERRGRAMGWFSAAQAIGVSAGPALGGFLLGVLGWRWIFWVTVPFAAAAVILSWLVVPRTTDLDPDRRFDGRGALLLTPGLVALMLTIMELHAWGPLSARTILSLLVALVLLAAFIRRERATDAPLIALRMFRSPAFSGGSVAVLLSYAMLYGMFFSAAFALVRGYHDAPIAAGLRLTIIPLALGLVAPFAGALYDSRPRLVMAGGMALCLIAAIALSVALNGQPGSLRWVMLLLAAYGAGLGLFIAPNSSATIAAAPAAKSGEAGAIINLLRAFGTGTGVATASCLLEWRLALSTGAGQTTMGVPEPALLAAIGDVFLMLAAFAVIAAAGALLRSSGRARS